jgi:hypothetical protein
MARNTPAPDDEDLLKHVSIGRVPDPGPQIRRDYSPKGPYDPKLNDMVWVSYTTGDTMVIGAPPGREEDVRNELLKAKNYLNHIHRDNDPKVDIRGLGKAAVQVVTAEEIAAMPAKDRAAYRKVVPEGWNGVRFIARPPVMKGRRAQQARLRAAGSKRGQATVTDIKDRGGVPATKFSG